MSEIVNLIYIDGKGVNSNKYYNMFEKGNGTFDVEYGRVGSTKVTHNYPMSKWNSTKKSKIKKGYTDVSNLRQVTTTIKKDTGTSAFNSFYDTFSKYTGTAVSSNYLVDNCTPAQLAEAQDILNNIIKLTSVDAINDNLINLYKVIPRAMGDVRANLVTKPSDLNARVIREQDALDAMDSSNVIHEEDVYGSLGVVFEDATAQEVKMLQDLINPSNNGYRSARIHKCYKVTHSYTQNKFDKWLSQQENKSTELLFHGTRNANVFSILKSGLLVRPSNAVAFAGSAYGDGVYHSAHTAKSLGYTGYERDKLFFIQKVHMGNPYKYEGYYRNNKDISRSQMNYKGLNKLGYDSLFVSPGDGLLNSEYIVYNSEQTTTNYLVWFI